ncbi:MAG TPA: hypothetical protein VF990_09540 [Candidatus Dormibacteraeota bacterium]
MSNWRTRAALGVLEAFLALTALYGALIVVPNLPRDWIAGSIFPDYMVPAFGLGVLVGGSAAIAVLALVFQPKLGAAAAMFSAAMILGFELVEIVTVGFSPLTYGVTSPQSWLQVAYIALGVVIALIGAGLWRAEGGRNPFAAGSSNRRWMA